MLGGGGKKIPLLFCFRTEHFSKQLGHHSFQGDRGTELSRLDWILNRAFIPPDETHRLVKFRQSQFRQRERRREKTWQANVKNRMLLLRSMEGG